MKWNIKAKASADSVLKNIPDKQVTRHLKSSLRGFYKKSVKDIKSRKEEVVAGTRQMDDTDRSYDQYGRADRKGR